ncbi:CoA-binding protein [Oceanotoga sp. DSM 15011]|uniref:succinate--CoA ligase subunit alpha n=1 Tax=unclassified Oceanotoga TaxID=2618448 RepID=UPI0021F451B8|nr:MULTISPECIES: CoA-binding protein [unclassified Oceanotoga]MDN5341698.1 succinyl-CoA synthetase alpha subunit [Oceanotoga sp.]UYO98866.1 CoA-binding protein [Oceanotoga sp. DSM 15011]
MINGKERVCVQGITGKYGQFHTKKMKEYGTNIVCGVSKNDLIDEVYDIPVLKTMKEAVEKYNADTSIIFIPAKNVKSAVLEAIESGIKKIIIITEHVPVHDMLIIKSKADENKVLIIGPNCPGIILPERSKIGIMPEKAFKKGDIAIISKSGTLMYEIADYLSNNSTGISIGIGLGGDMIIGTGLKEAFDYIIENKIKKVIIIGEVGGSEEIKGIRYALENNYDGKIKAFFAGRTAPKGKTMGHAGAIIEGYEGSIEYKEKVLSDLNIKVCKSIKDLIS